MNQHYAGPIPGASQKQLDQVAAIDAACQAAGSTRDIDTLEAFADTFIRWLKNRNDDTDGEVRRRILLSVTANVDAVSTHGDAPKKLVKLTDQLYWRIK